MISTRAKSLENYLTAYLNALVDLDKDTSTSLSKPLKKYREASTRHYVRTTTMFLRIKPRLTHWKPRWTTPAPSRKHTWKPWKTPTPYAGPWKKGIKKALLEQTVRRGKL